MEQQGQGGNEKERKYVIRCAVQGLELDLLFTNTCDSPSSSLSSSSSQSISSLPAALGARAEPFTA